MEDEVKRLQKELASRQEEVEKLNIAHNHFASVMEQRALTAEARITQLEQLLSAFTTEAIDGLKYAQDWKRIERLQDLEMNAAEDSRYAAAERAARGSSLQDKKDGA